MYIWKLTPVSTEDPLWIASSHRGPVTVRAPDEQTARAKTQEQFGVAVRFPAGTRIAGGPWKRPNLVRAEILDHSPHSTDGPPEVLEPSFETDLPAQPRKP